MIEQQFIRISFQEAFRFFWRGLLPALLVGAALAGVALLVSRSSEPVFRSTSILLATRPASAFSNVASVIAPSQLDPAIYRNAIVQGDLLPQALARVLGRPPSPTELEDWRNRVRVRVDENLVSSLVSIEVDDATASLASSVANALSDALLTWDRTRVTRNIQATLSSLDRSIALLGAQILAAQESSDGIAVESLTITRDQLIAERRSAESLNFSAVVLGLLEPFREAVPSSTPIADRAVFYSAIAAVIGVLLTYMFLLMVRVVNPKVGTEADVVRILGQEPLAVIPRPKDGPNRFQAAIGQLALAIPQSSLGRETDFPEERSGLVVLVTALRGSDSRRALTLGLSKAYVGASYRTLVVDTDFAYDSGTAELSRRAEQVAVIDLVRGGSKAEPTSVQIENGNFVDLIQFHPGTASPTSYALLARQLSKFVVAWRERYDVIIIEVSSLYDSAAALAMSDSVDCVLLGIIAGKDYASAAQDAVSTLERSGYKNVQTVLVKERARRDAQAASTEKLSRTPEARMKVVQNSGRR